MKKYIWLVGIACSLSAMEKGSEESIPNELSNDHPHKETELDEHHKFILQMIAIQNKFTVTPYFQNYSKEEIGSDTDLS